MYIICGLGNPGKKYENTRHNLGFMAIDRLSEELDIPVSKEKFRSLVGEGRVSGEKVMLMKPETFMNDSGLALREAATFYDVDPGNILVIYDDLDIPTGSVRIRPFGGPGTHNGMRSVVKELANDRFPRIRIGSGAGKIESEDIVGYVLSGFSNEDKKIVRDALERAVNAAKCYIESGIDIAMNRYNIKNQGQINEGNE